MNTTNKERFELLMKQIGIPDDMKNKYFQNGSIEKLEVYRQSKIWQFHLLIENVLPAEAYQLFALKLTEAFSTIAKVSWVFKTQNSILSNEEWGNYWSVFYSELIHHSPKYRALENKRPLVNDNNIMLTVSNEIELHSLKQELQTKLDEFCVKIGTERKMVEMEVVDQQAELEKFQQEKALEDRKRVEEAFKQQEQKSERK